MDTMPEPTVSFSLTVKNGSSALKFYTDAFGAEELYRLPTPEGGVAHAEFMIGNSRICLSEEAPDWFAAAMPENMMASCLFSIVTEDCERSCERAMRAGADLLTKPTVQFWGAKMAILRDPYGYRWAFSQKVEDVSPEELARRAQEYFSS